MYFDALTLAAVAEELRTTILHGRVQRVVLPDAWSIGIEVYAHHQRYQLLASAHPQYARVHLVGEKLSRGVDHASPLLLLLRKYVLGGRIAAIIVPPLERVLSVSIVKDTRTCNFSGEESGNEHESERENESVSEPENEPGSQTESTGCCKLIIEPMDRRSNIVLVDEHGDILESVKRVSPRMSRRVILPRHPYLPPPPQEKPDPRNTTAEEVLAIVLGGEGDWQNLERALVRGYRGVSPQVAREVLCRAGGDATTQTQHEQCQRIAMAFQQIFAAPVAPTLIYPNPTGDAGGELSRHAYAPYCITHLPNAQSQATISMALERYYAAQQTLTHHQQYRSEMLQQLEQSRERLLRQQQHLQREQEQNDNAEHLRWEGEMILAFLHAIQPGQRVLEVEGQAIMLDPDSTPLACAQLRFRSYQKAQSGMERVGERLRETAIQLSGIDQLAVLLELAETREHIQQLVGEGIAQGYLTAPPQKKQKSVRLKPLHLISGDGFEIYVGRSAEQNGEVTFRIGSGQDLWFHVRGQPGAHVLVRTGGRTVPESTLREAAGLAAFFSRARGEKAVEVDVARRNQVRRVPGGSPGLVTCRTEQTLLVTPLPPWT